MGTRSSSPSADVAVRRVDADSVSGISAYAQGRRLPGCVLGRVSEQLLNDAVDGPRHSGIDAIGVLNEDALIERLTGAEGLVNDLGQFRQGQVRCHAGLGKHRQQGMQVIDGCSCPSLYLVGGLDDVRIVPKLSL